MITTQEVYESLTDEQRAHLERLAMDFSSTFPGLTFDGAFSAIIALVTREQNKRDLSQADLG